MSKDIVTDTATSGDVRAARRLAFYRLAAEHAVAGWNPYMAETALCTERDYSPPDDPSRAWTDDDLEAIVRRVYATHRSATTESLTDSQADTEVVR